MTQQDRRKFLRTVAATAGAAAAYAHFPPAIARALRTRAFNETGTIQDVKHVVILMQENRSFDHYFGTMSGVRGFGDRFPIPLASGKPVWYESDGTKEIPPYHLDSTTNNALLVPDTPHSFSDTQIAWAQGMYGYWPKYKTQYSMGHYQRADIPFQFALAEAFTICDAYHCSVTTGTDPNRIVFWSGSNFDPALRAQGINCNDRSSEPDNDRCWITSASTPWVDGQYNYVLPDNAFTWDTIPDVLQKAGVTWRIYQDMNNNWTGAMNGCLAFQSFRTCQPGSPIYVNGMTTYSVDDLANDVKNDTLAEVVWILPSQANSEHPGGPSSPTHAGEFISTVLDALTSNPDVWSKTVLFLTFDENDGFFDHLACPALPSYNLDGSLAGKSTMSLAGEYFDATSARQHLNSADNYSGTIRPFGPGIRVPMYVISPWSKGGWVDSQTFDHTSVGMFLEKRFGVTIAAISPFHRAISGDMTSAFDFVSPNDPSFPTLPDMSNWQASDAAQKQLPPAVPPATPQPLFQEVGTRFSRALPYELHVTASVVPNTSTLGATKVTLDFVNSGTKGVVFHVYDQLNLGKLPRRYVVEAGKELSDVWTPASSGSYDLWVLGPNGFHRHFTGNAKKVAAAAQPNPEVLVDYDVANKQVVLTLSNAGPVACTFSVATNAYGTSAPVATTVAARSQTKVTWSVAASGNWYDLSITVKGWTDFVRRAAGRVETGAASVSDPAMATQL
jgi:phospholipase C